MVTLVRYLLLWSLPLGIIYAYSRIDIYIKLKNTIPQKMVFKYSEYSWGDNTGGDPDIRACGYILNHKEIDKISIGFQESYSKIDRFENEELSNLKDGDSISVWYNPINSFATYRPPNISKEQYIYEYKKKYLINYTIYIIFLITFEYLFRKEWKKEDKEISTNYFKN